MWNLKSALDDSGNFVIVLLFNQDIKSLKCIKLCDSRIIRSHFTDQSTAVLPELFSDATLHNDCINSASFHPHSSKTFATSSGQRHHKIDLTKWNCSSDEASDSEEDCIIESSIKVWNFDIDQIINSVEFNQLIILCIEGLT